MVTPTSPKITHEAGPRASGETSPILATRSGGGGGGSGGGHSAPSGTAAAVAWNGGRGRAVSAGGGLGLAPIKTEAIRVVAHIDMDAFYAQIEQVHFDIRCLVKSSCLRALTHQSSLCLMPVKVPCRVLHRCSLQPRYSGSQKQSCLSPGRQGEFGGLNLSSDASPTRAFALIMSISDEAFHHRAIKSRFHRALVNIRANASSERNLTQSNVHSSEIEVSAPAVSKHVSPCRLSAQPTTIIWK